jgi:hypothetical protein
MQIGGRKSRRPNTSTKCEKNLKRHEILRVTTKYCDPRASPVSRNVGSRISEYPQELLGSKVEVKSLRMRLSQ